MSKPSWEQTFHIDQASSNEEYLYVDVFGKGTVAIKNEHEGIVVDIYPLHVADESVASIYVFNDELTNEEDT